MLLLLRALCCAVLISHRYAQTHLQLALARGGNPGSEAALLAELNERIQALEAEKREVRLRVCARVCSHGRSRAACS